MTSAPLESQMIAKVAEDYRRRGYDVAVQPRGVDVPDFLNDFQPDLIARGPGEAVVVEVKVNPVTSVERLREVAERVNRQPGWRFSLVYVSPKRPDELVESRPASLAVSKERARNAEALLGAGQKEAAFLLLWSAVEGTLRFLGERAGLPLASLPTSALIRELYSTGEISARQFQSLLHFLPARNRLVHGVDAADPIDAEGLRHLGEELLAEANTTSLE